MCEYDEVVMKILSRSVMNENGCMEWMGALDSKGYGRISFKGRLRGVHEIMWEFRNGFVPDGLELDHIKCDNPKCWVTEHLKPVTHKENVLRSMINVCAIKARQVECIRGHFLSGENLFISSRGRRVCIICRRKYQREYRKTHDRFLEIALRTGTL